MISWEQRIAKWYGDTDYQAESEQELKKEYFFTAVRENNIEKLKSIAQNTPEVLTYKNNLRQSALHIACQPSKNKEGATEKSFETLKFLLKALPKNAKDNNETRFIDSRDCEGLSALMVAADQGNPKHAKLLMTYHPNLKIEEYDSKRTILHLAAQKNNPDFLHMILSARTPAGVPVIKINSACRSAEYRNWTAAHFAADNYAPDAMKALVEYGADVNAKTSFGKTPLMLAFESGSDRVASYLLDLDQTNVLLVDSKGHTAYDYAVNFKAEPHTFAQLKKRISEQAEKVVAKEDNILKVIQMLSKQHTR